MNRIAILSVSAVVCAAIARADAPVASKAPVAPTGPSAVSTNSYANLSPEEKAKKRAELKERFRVMTEQKTGGKIRRAGSEKGMFVVLNAQSAVNDADLSPVISTIDQWVHVRAAIKSARSGVTVSIGNVKDEIKAAGGVLGVALVEADGLPAFLAAPEDGWVLVNVRALAKDATKEVLAARVRKEALRAYAFVTGGIYMSRAPFLMRDVKDVADLDAIPHEVFALDTLSHMNTSSSHYGLTPYYQTTYRKACTEGWAPAPTNDFQKAIWDEIHAMPTAPMKILPESQKQKK